MVDHAVDESSVCRSGCILPSFMEEVVHHLSGRETGHAFLATHATGEKRLNCPLRGSYGPSDHLAAIGL